MGDPKGFLNIKRQSALARPVKERLTDFREVETRLARDKIQEQGARCMDCGVPFCHYVCPVGNVIPDWNDFIFRGQWAKALEILLCANDFPEFSGRVCPALCEAACVVGLGDEPVTIRQNEISVIEWGFKQGLIKPVIPRRRTNKRAAVIGSGPAGLAAARGLTKRGHKVVLFEADDKCGGILRYGIPDFKLEKWVIERRLELMKQEGLEIQAGVRVGRDISKDGLLESFDAVCLAIGSRVPRELSVEGRQLKGIHQAMDYLKQSNKINNGVAIAASELISAKDKRVVVIGGGDTGADCVGTANRQGARSVTQIEVLAKPPLCRTKEMPWPQYPRILKTSSSHEEGCERLWGILTKSFSGPAGRVVRLRPSASSGLRSLQVAKIQAVKVEAKPPMREVPGSGFELDADLVILAMGFIHPEHEGLVSDLGLKTTSQGNIYIDKNYMTSRPGVFAAGDAGRGASLVVWALYDGRQAAEAMDRYLMSSNRNF